MSVNPVPPPETGEPPKWAAEPLAVDEEKYFSDEAALKGQRTKNDVHWLKSYGLALILLLWVFVGLFASSLIVWAAHYILPECWGWLSDEQLSRIQSVIFSGSLGGIVSFIAQRQLSKQ